VVVQDTQLHLQLPTYKSDANAGSGFAVEKGFAPRPLGAWWIRFTVDGADRRLRISEMRAT